MTPANPTTLVGLISSIPDDQTAIIQPEQNIRISYGNLKRQVQDVADALAAAGVHRGDRVGIALPNGVANVVAFLAASMAGIAAPLNPAYKEDEFRFYLEDTNARVLLLPPEGIDDARRAAATRHVPILTVDMDADGTVALSGGTARTPAATPAPTDAALILHTSGSTGRPKRVPLTHANLSISARNVARSYALSKDDVSLCVMPLFHVHGLVASTLATLSTGGTVVVAAESSARSRSGASRTITAPRGTRRFRRSINCCWPAPTRVEHDRRAQRSCASFVSCSASLPPQVMHDLEAAFGAPVLEAYGMTEAAHQMASNPLPPAQRLPGSVGSRDGCPDQHHGSTRKASGHRRTRRSRDSGTERRHRVRQQPRGQRDVVYRRLVPDRRSGIPRRERLSRRSPGASKK